MKTNTAIFLSVRDKSTRLPGKVCKIIQDQMVIEHLIDRLKLSRRAGKLVMATSTHIQDNHLIEIAKKKEIDYFRGHEEDKLKRYLDAAQQFFCDFVVIVDGDDLFADWEFIDKIIDNYLESQSDYIVYDKLPLGVTGFGVKVEALKRVVETKKEINTEIWGEYFSNPKLFKKNSLEPSLEFQRPQYRMTLDYLEDFRLFEEIFNKLYTGSPIPLLDILQFLDKNSDLATSNIEAQKKYELNARSLKELVEKDLETWGEV